MNLPSTATRRVNSLRANSLRVAYILAWAALCAGLISVVAAFGYGTYATAFISDAMFVPVFVRDVLARATVAGWDLPTNPYIVPDLLLYATLHLLVNDVYWAATLYGVIQLLLLIVGFRLLDHSVLDDAKAPRLLALHAMGLFVFLVGAGKHIYHDLAVISLAHFGVVVMIPFALWATLRVINTAAPPAKQRRALYALGALVAVASLSDSLFIVQFVLPVAVALLGVGWFTGAPSRRLALLVGTILLAAALGQWAQQAVAPVEKLLLYTEKTNLEDIALSLRGVIVWAQACFAASPLLTVFWVSSTLALVAALVIAAVQWRRDMRQAGTAAALLPRIMLVCAVALGSIATSFAAAIVSGNFAEEVTSRYVLPAIVLPMLMGWPYLIALAPPITRRRTLQGVGLALCTLSLLMIGGVIARRPLAGVAAISSFQTPLATCLKEETARRGLTQGLAGYWDATSNMALAEGGLQLLQVTHELVPFYWNNNRAWYDEPFDYVLTNPDALPNFLITPEMVTQKLGTPSDTFECGDSTVLVYPQPGDARTRYLFDESFALADLTEEGAEVTMPGYTLSSRIGALPIGLSLAASERWGNREGDLAVAPFILRNRMPAGDYAVEYRVYADSADTGSWDVVRVAGDQLLTLAAGAVTQPGSSVITATFTVPERSDVDLRVQYAGHGTLFVDQIRLKRLGQPPGEPPPAAAQTEQAQAAALRLVYPEEGAEITDRTTDFVWEWTGPPLDANQAFEVRLWHADDPFHYGAHDARLSAQDVRQVHDTDILRLDLNGAYALQEHGPGDYFWSVGIVATEPAYQDLGSEAPPRLLHVLP